MQIATSFFLSNLIISIFYKDTVHVINLSLSQHGDSRVSPYQEHELILRFLHFNTVYRFYTVDTVD